VDHVRRIGRSVASPPKPVWPSGSAGYRVAPSRAVAPTSSYRLHRRHESREGTPQSAGRAAKSRLAFLCHPIPETGCFHLPFISFNAPSCVASPCATTSFRCLSCPPSRRAGAGSVGPIAVAKTPFIPPTHGARHVFRRVSLELSRLLTVLTLDTPHAAG
jgi:hypothetical protein